MTIHEKSLALSLPEGLKELEKVQTQVIDNWHTSIDTALDSLSQIFNFGSNTLNNFNRFQNENLDIYLNGLSPARIDRNRVDDAPATEKRPEARTGVAVVTGGIGGIGTAICQRLSRDNASIIATYIKGEKKYAVEWRQLRADEGMNVDIVECDVSDFTSCKKTARAIEKKHGRIDVLVNCAGITRDAMLNKMDEENWHVVLDTNLDSVFNVTRNFINGMIKRSYGRIINISSVNGQKGQFGQTNYSSAKAGMIGFSRSLAVELAGTGVTVNCVCPGYVATSMVEAIPEHIKEAIVAQIPVGRLAQPSEIAHAVAFLACRDSAYITGTELAVNGGLWTG